MLFFIFFALPGFLTLIFCFLTDSGSGAGQTSGSEGPVVSSLLVWVMSGCTLLLVVIVVLVVVLWRYHRRGCVPESRQSAPISLNTLAAPKRDSFSSDNNGSERSDVVFPLRPSDSMLCRHYERVSCDYGPPVYIVQEIAPQNPTNVYYKVWFLPIKLRKTSSVRLGSTLVTVTSFYLFFFNFVVYLKAFVLLRIICRITPRAQNRLGSSGKCEEHWEATCWWLCVAFF